MILFIVVVILGLWTILGGVQTLINMENFYWPGLNGQLYLNQKKLSKKQKRFIYVVGGPLVWIFIPLIMVVNKVNAYGRKKFNSWWEEAGDDE